MPLLNTVTETYTRQGSKNASTFFKWIFCAIIYLWLFAIYQNATAVMVFCPLAKTQRSSQQRKQRAIVCLTSNKNYAIEMSTCSVLEYELTIYSSPWI